MKRIPKYLAGYQGEYCFLCGRNGTEDPLEEHHIFNGPYRKKSERYGLTVRLCAHRCHNGGPDSVHRNQDVDRELKQRGQRKAMEENGWSVEEFIREFGKNYLDDEEESAEFKVQSAVEETEGPGTLARMGAFAAEMARKRRERMAGIPEGCFEDMP